MELKAGAYRYEWIDSTSGASVANGRIESSGKGLQFQAPYDGDAVLYLTVQ